MLTGTFADAMTNGGNFQVENFQGPDLGIVFKSLSPAHKLAGLPVKAVIIKWRPTKFNLGLGVITKS
jgi:hypothetical protein